MIFFFEKLYNIYKSDPGVIRRVGAVLCFVLFCLFAELYKSKKEKKKKKHPARGKVPSNPINRHGALCWSWETLRVGRGVRVAIII